MIEVIHTPRGTDVNHYDIIGNDISELVDECLKRIRAKSQTFYRWELTNDLTKYGHSVIDRWAGTGFSYSVKLITK